MALLISGTRVYGNTIIDSQLVVGNVTPYAATSNITGTIKVTGGVGITGNLYSGNIVITGASNGVTFVDGTIQSTAGSSVANTVYLQGALATANANTVFLTGVNSTQNTWISSNSAYSQAAFAQANLTVGGLVTANANTIYLQGALAAANANTVYLQGALAAANANITYTQGVDATQNSWISSNSFYSQAGFAQANSAGANSVFIAGGLASANANIVYTQGVDTTQNTSINNKLSLTGATNQTVSGNVTISQDLIVSGNLILTGNINSQNVQSLSVADPLIVLGVGNYLSDTKDIGFAGHYNDGANAHTGIFRDSGTKEWYVFKGYTPEVDATNNIDVTDASFAKANLNASYVKGNLIANSVVVNGVDLYNYSNSSYAQANSAGANTIYIQGALNTANANTIFLTGIENSQNANIIALQALANTDYTTITTSTGTFGSSVLVPVITVAANGRVTNITTTSVSGSPGAVTNSFSTILVSGQPNLFANSATAPLTIVAGSGMSITTNSTSNTVTFNSTGGFSGGTIANQLIVANSISSTSTTTGALQVQGGVGISGNVWVGNIFTTNNQVALGLNAGLTPLGVYTTSVGGYAGNSNQGAYSVAVGVNAGQNDQGTTSVAIGSNAAQTSQGQYSVAIGQYSGRVNQQNYATAVGWSAADTTQGAYSLALGYNASTGYATAAGSIILSAGLTTYVPFANNAGLYVSPVRNDTSNTANVVYYNSVTKELTYAPAPAGVGASQLIVANTYSSYSNSNNALQVSGGVGVANSVYVGGRVGFGNTTTSFAYTTYNSTFNSIDTIFG